jgi:cytochrome c-type biogenesis protein CcmH/NrfG
MTSSSKDYFVVREAKEKRKKKLLAIISVVCFGGSMLFGAVGTVRQALRTPQAQPEPISVEASLQQQAEGYELVLQREPENQMALEQLSLLRIRLEDFTGAMEPLEKLISLHPEREDYQVMLDNVQKWQSESDRNFLE